MDTAIYKKPEPFASATNCHSNYKNFLQQQKPEKSEPKRVVFVLGAPGSGKGTLCAALAQYFGFVHFSIGDLLRAECRIPKSKLKEQIQSNMQNGNIVPTSITVKLLEKAIFFNSQSDYFLIDAFPFNQQNLEAWIEQELLNKVEVAFVLYLDVPLEVCAQRCLDRNQGRLDDNEECIQKRMLTYNSQCKPIVEHYKGLNMIRVIDASMTPEQVFNAAKEKFEELFCTPPTQGRQTMKNNSRKN